MYSLEKVASKHSPIYKQIWQYYHFCEHTRGMSPESIKSKTYVLNYFIKFSRLRDLRKISNPIIMEWIDDQRARGNSGRSINIRLAHLKAMLHWQREANLNMPELKLGLITKVTEKPARKKCFSRVQINHALECSDRRTWLFIRLAFDCGLRISELQKLKRQDIYMDRITIFGKGNKRRYAFAANDVQIQLQKWIKEEHIADYLWKSPVYPNQPIAICTIRKAMQEAFASSGISDFCPHDLRHSYATDLKLLGVSTRKIQAGLGHNSESTTEKYLSDLDGYDLREIYQIKYS